MISAYEAKEEVWESEDVSFPEKEVEEETFASEGIEKIHIDIEEARRKFKGRLLDASTVDFSDPFTRARNRGYGGGKYVLEILGSTCDKSTETIDQKFNRLYLEINELTEQIEREKESGSDDYKASVNKNHVDILNDLIQSVAAEKSKCDGDVTEKHSEKELPKKVASEKRNKNDVAYISELESRIAQLEKAIGKTDMKNNEVPLVNILKNIQARVDSLNIQHSSIIEKKWTDIASSINNSSKISSEVLEDSKNIEKLNKLYELTGKWDSACDNLPTLVKRLRTLCALHEQSASFAGKLSNLELLQSTIQNQLKTDEENNAGFNKQFSAAISDILARLDKLKSK
uniref:Dynactin subunit 2 n=1 Tax=Rhabditophanes sp. KR3021 TaxID=114890 RepID=A0AC35TIS4_9BILA